ncbi:MAG: SLC13 family permease [Parvularculaceae bacterium]
MSVLDSVLQTLSGSPWQMWATLAIIAWAIVAYASDRLSVEIISVSIVVALMLLFELAPIRDESRASIIDSKDLLAGFADPALVAVLSLLIVAQGIFQSGTMDLPTKYILRAVEVQKTLVVGAIFILVVLVSAFLNDTPVVVMFLPIVAAMATAAKIPPSRVMMPLSFIALLGGATTLIGSSTNILAAGVFQKTAGAEIGFWDLTPMGALIAVVGMLYLATAGRLLLPHRSPDDKSGERENRQFIAQFELARGHFLVGKQPVAGLFPDLPDITVRMVQRREEAMLPPFDDFRFQIGDIVIVAATRAALTRLMKEHPGTVDSVLAEVAIEDEGRPEPRAQLAMVEAVVAPGSRLGGRTISQIGFHYQTNCVILGIERRSRMIRGRMSSIRLENGDVLLILGTVENVQALRADRDVLLLEWSLTGLPAPRNALTAGLIFIGVVATAAIGWMPISITAPCGVLAMLAFGCLNIRQAARAFDRRIYLLIGASLAMGLALEETGGALLLGGLLAPIAENFGPAALMSAVFAVSALTTNVLSNNATAVLLMPIAVNAARLAGIDPLPLALTVIYGANCPFVTPIGYQTNLLVMTPGHYKFMDYVKVGGPMLVLIWIVYSIVAPIYFEAVGRL